MSEMPQSKQRTSGARKIFTAFAVALGAAIVIVPLLALGLLGYSSYSIWLRGYGMDCTVRSKSDSVSPSGRWTARTRRAECYGVGEPGPWIDVVLISNDRPRFLARRRLVFDRDLGDMNAGSDRVDVKWVDDYTLELHTPSCAPQCWSTSVAGNVKVSVAAPEP